MLERQTKPANAIVRWARAAAVALVISAVGCAPAEPDARKAGADMPSEAPAVTAAPAPMAPPAVSVPSPISDPLEDAQGKAGSDPGDPDRSCQTDADCTVKNVGNCCGYYPACVNVDAVTDPAAVTAACAASGMSSICGFQEPAGCRCDAGKCAVIPGNGLGPATTQ